MTRAHGILALAGRTAPPAKPAPQPYTAPPAPSPNALIAKVARECARHIEAHADPDRARSAVLDAFAQMLDVAIRDERDRLAGMVDAFRRAGW